MCNNKIQGATWPVEGEGGGRGVWERSLTTPEASDFSTQNYNNQPKESEARPHSASTTFYHF